MDGLYSLLSKAFSHTGKPPQGFYCYAHLMRTHFGTVEHIFPLP